MRSLPLFHRVAGQLVIVLGEGPAADAKRRLVERAGGVVAAEDEPAARLAFVAMDDPGPAAARLKARGLLVNVADRPELCDFTVPSVLDRDPVLVAVGTSGASAGLAKQLRLRFEALLPTDLGRLAEALFAARDTLRQRWPGAADRRRALDSALTEGGPLDPMRQGAADRIAAWIEHGPATAGSQTIELTIASDDPDDLTLRQARLLGTADVLLIEAGFPEAILARARADAVRHELTCEVAPVDGLTLVLRRK